ncbi:type II toxin-antitoxin system HicA family toxin [Candidatus Aminicenantes bacterium AC-335-B20]|nr:type II toxin-antitoxin system HicA family toxin [SCandidatus Aminicenantes bacterium Aminicenantia_JdfR_composite]MCP2596322.1 type II toxin-antitoxin system HicA family toxin [Candidatus Aminicenantes bacterium AC-335-G13]MCP2599158.1 type II toxin-antitoxin system HicA family toxin [Candidatus Aminicenantes bacterium AC-335-B20]MCP2617796.1 type II toxin-antitoxin system HicA family toxin [Candidatus Aminicenantes bacterium AC-335-A11]
MKAISGKEFAKLLERKGWVLKRIKGSHHIYMKEGINVRISVPIHGNKPLKLGLLKYFMKVAGIDESEL